jgi:hypothetical protein
MFQVQGGLWHLLPGFDMLCRFGDLASENRVSSGRASLSS